MKKTIFAALLILPFLIFSCKSGKKTDEVKNYSYQEDSKKLNPELQAKLGSWIEEGSVCYGIVIAFDKEGKITNGMSVKAKVIEIRKDSIKMKAIERANLAEVEGCTKYGLERGETWWENEGDLFLSKEEADAYLAKKGWAGGKKIKKKQADS